MNNIFRIFSASALLLAAAPARAQDFNTSLKPYNKPYTAVADATYVKPVAVNMGAYGVMTALMSAGRNLTDKSVITRHAMIHAGVLAGKYPGANPEYSARMLGLLGSSNSPLVGDPKIIPAILGALSRAISNGTVETQLSAMVSIAMVAVANPSVQIPSVNKTASDWALSFLYNIVTNEDKKFEFRRGAVAALAAFESPAGVAKISSCISKLIADNSDGEDEVFGITSKGELVDEGTKGKTLVASLMLALEAQMEGAASAEALKFMKFYALLATTDKSCKARSMYGDPLGLETNKDQYRNKTTILMARFILARDSAPQYGAPYGQAAKPATMWSKVVSEDNGYGRIFMRETANAACLIPIIEDDGFKCETRKAFYSKYDTLAGNQLSYYYQTGNPPMRPVNFDNCLRAFTNKAMLGLAKEMVTGALWGAVIKGSIRGLAWGLKTWSINRAYKVVAITGRTVKAAKYANFGGAVGQYEEGLIKLYNFYDDAKDLKDFPEVFVEAKK